MYGFTRNFKLYRKLDSGLSLQGDQIYMAAWFWYLVKSDLFSVIYCSVNSSKQWTSPFLQGTRTTRPCLSGQVVYQTWWNLSKDETLIQGDLNDVSICVLFTCMKS